MDDQSLDALIAGLFEESGPGPDTPPSEQSNDMSLQTSESEGEPAADVAATADPAESSVEAGQEPQAAAETAEAPSPDPVYAEYVASLETELAQRREAEERAKELIAQRDREQREQQAREIAQQLHDWDPALGERYVNAQKSLNSELVDVHREVGKLNSALDALSLALEDSFDPAIVDQVVLRAKDLMSLPHEARVEQLAREQQIRAESDQRSRELQAEVALLREQLEAAQRSPSADVVDGAGGGHAVTQDWRRAEGFDDFFDGWYAENFSPPA